MTCLDTSKDRDTACPAPRAGVPGRAPVDREAAALGRLVPEERMGVASLTKAQALLSSRA